MIGAADFLDILKVLSVNIGAGVFVPVFLLLADADPSYETLLLDDYRPSFIIILTTCSGDYVLSGIFSSSTSLTDFISIFCDSSPFNS